MAREPSTSTKRDRDLSPALLWHRGDRKRVICDLCAHRCSILPGKCGVCRVRLNRDGVLLTAVRNKLVAANADPIEKKPLFHFLPGTLSFSIAAIGCNFRCSFCQNWQISQHARDHGTVLGQDTEPAAILESARRAGALSIAYTYTEPTVFFETCEEVGIMAREAGLKNVFVTNGYLTPEAAARATSFLDGANVDFKGFDDHRYRRVCGATLKGVLDGIEALLDSGVWVEITTLVVPGLNDSEEELKALAGRIAGWSPSIPWHLSRFHPDYRMTGPPATPLSTLERAYAIGREAGLAYVYLGNLSGHVSENTLCPNCETMVIGRRGFRLTGSTLDGGRCPSCNTRIDGVFDF